MTDKATVEMPSPVAGVVAGARRQGRRRARRGQRPDPARSRRRGQRRSGRCAGASRRVIVHCGGTGRDAGAGGARRGALAAAQPAAPPRPAAPGDAAPAAAGRLPRAPGTSRSRRRRCAAAPGTSVSTWQFVAGSGPAVASCTRTSAPARRASAVRVAPAMPPSRYAPSARRGGRAGDRPAAPDRPAHAGVDAPDPALHLRRGNRRHRARGAARAAQRRARRDARPPHRAAVPDARDRARRPVVPADSNARYDDEAGIVTRHAAVHIGIATQTAGGLMVPVVRHAEARDLWSSAAEVARLADAARAGKATRDELSGSTITITSLGPLRRHRHHADDQPAGSRDHRRQPHRRAAGHRAAARSCRGCS